MHLIPGLSAGERDPLPLNAGEICRYVGYWITLALPPSLESACCSKAVILGQNFSGVLVGS